MSRREDVVNALEDIDAQIGSLRDLDGYLMEIARARLRRVVEIIARANLPKTVPFYTRTRACEGDIRIASVNISTACADPYKNNFARHRGSFIKLLNLITLKMVTGNPYSGDEELIIFDATSIWKDGRVLTDPREIVEYIDTQMRPPSLDDGQDPEEIWPLLRAHLMHMYLTTPEERAEAFQQAVKDGVDIGHWILERMREKYLEYW